MLKITSDMAAALNAPLPPEAIKPHPSKTYLSTITDIYIIERLNQVFGVGAWKVRVEHITTQGKMVVVKVFFSVPEYDVEYECYGGNDNADLGDAYKGATTDALTKICSWLGIANEVWKMGKPKQQTPQRSQPQQPAPAPQRKTLTTDNLLDSTYLAGVCDFLHKKSQGKTLAETIIKYYVCDEEAMTFLSNEYLRIYG